MKVNKMILTVTIFSLGSLNISAAPSAYSNACGPLNINNQTKSTLIRDNQDCGTVWVLPPTSGKTSLAGFDPNSNLRLCQGLEPALLYVPLARLLQNASSRARCSIRWGRNNTLQSEDQMRAPGRPSIVRTEILCREERMHKRWVCRHGVRSTTALRREQSGSGFQRTSG